MQTIFALATARGKSGVAVIRISGPDAHQVATCLAGDLPRPGQFALRTLRDASELLLDEGLVLRFDAPRSFTGEDTVELQLHGSIAVIRAVERAIAETGLARVAEPGEFTRRALMNGNLDLAQVEGLSDLIAAETEAQRQQAQGLFSGRMRKFADRCRADLLRAAALIEATIDFADEEVPVDVSPEVGDLIGSVLGAIDEQISGFSGAERLRHGFEVAIIGQPNVGKSTLLNRIAGRDIAITSEIAGTTRDVLEVRVDLDGLPVTFLDTAGLRDSDDVIEKIGVARARERAAAADLRILLEDGVEPTHGFDPGVAIDFRYETKSDITGRGISAFTGEGIDRLLADVSAALADRVSDTAIASHERHRQAIMRARASLAEADLVFHAGIEGAEILALHLRDGARALDSLIGRMDVEAVLGEIFAQFCIGK
ncbi:tRNA uridine-5-carboxymethylaminomethyl(34) synthesis GTPase MnmE [Roseicyclus mahoneyensis]|uniref:tRNA modification GTPase MnmE n=1 Tax=Roseicyclus mahoneyensis TaxID=164332 RepID=A0A316GKF9_9RHOB|nr:tRNA uridine-5-carboxymethylaminomethyl(34) synthesis GTPase MnmE [Roseicyclus mahoneyensis]PWK61588.1 tRNA modification GTPase trmE [Roseicyclus mahoneyensis]